MIGDSAVVFGSEVPLWLWLLHDLGSTCPFLAYTSTRISSPSLVGLTVHFCRLCRSKDLPVSSVQFSRSVMSDSLRPHGLQQARPPITNSWSLPKLMSIELVMPSSHLILCRPFLLLPSILPLKIFTKGEPQSIDSVFSSKRRNERLV